MQNVDSVENDDGHEKKGMDVDSEWCDSSLTENVDHDHETYRGDERGLRIWEKKNVTGKGKEKMVEGGTSEKNDDDDDDVMMDMRRKLSI